MKKREIKADDMIVACAKAMADDEKAKKIMMRSGLNKEELKMSMTAIQVKNGQALVHHPHLGRPFQAHVKFFDHAHA